MTGRRLGGRFVLRERLGRGATGEVWAADDTHAKAPAVVKLLGPEADAARVQREVAALAALDIPGVVGLLDRGDGPDGPWIAMPHVPGSPFPGRPAPAPPDVVHALARQLLEVVAAIHDAGLLHRDLKPANVLVDERRVTVLDFGLSRGALLGSTITATGEFVGTPRYVAPEQVRGDEVDARADLWSIGCMLFEALTGRAPHPETTVSSLLLARVSRPAPPVRAIAPEVPHELADLVDRLLALDPEDRPESAGAAIRALTAPSDARELPFLGRDRVDAIVSRLRSGEHVRLVVPAGFGRRRFAREVEAGLQAAGLRVARPGDGVEPFESAPVPVAGPLASADAQIREALGHDAVWVVAQPERVDAWTVRALEGAPRVLLLPASGGGERLPPLSAADLEALFHGPRLCLHLPEDAAEELLARTAGAPGAVADEVAAWVRWGLACWDGDKLRITRDAIGRLREGAWLPAATRAAGDTGRLAEHQRRVLGWLVLARRAVSVATLGRAMERPLAWVEATVHELVDAGLVRRRVDGRLTAVAAASVVRGWSAGQRRLAHRALALAMAPGTDGRLGQLLAGGLHEELAAEAATVARKALDEGRLGDARAVLETAALAVEPEALVEVWAEVAMTERSLAGLDRFAEIATRAGTRDLVELAEATKRFVRQEPAPDVEAAFAALPRFEARALERWRLALPVLAWTREDVGEAERMLAPLRAWAEAEHDLAFVEELEGRVRYVRGDFEGAAGLHRKAAMRQVSVSARIAAWTNAAAAWIEADVLGPAEEAAKAALLLAVSARHPVYELRARQLLRAVAYRCEEARRVDELLVDAAVRVGSPGFASMLLVTEAAVSWRAGEHSRAGALANMAHDLALQGGAHACAILARALAFHCGKGEPPTTDELVHLPKALAAQAMWLVGDSAWQAMARALPTAMHPFRREVLAIAELVQDR